MCDVDEEVVAAFVEVLNAEGEKAAVSEDGEKEDEVDTEGASDSSDVVKSGSPTLLAINWKGKCYF